MTDIAQLKKLVNKDKIIGFYLALAPLERGWIVLFELSDGERRVLTKARSKNYRVYKLADTALKDIKSMGVYDIKVIF